MGRERQVDRDYIQLPVTRVPVTSFESKSSQLPDSPTLKKWKRATPVSGSVTHLVQNLVGRSVHVNGLPFSSWAATYARMASRRCGALVSCVLGGTATRLCERGRRRNRRIHGHCRVVAPPRFASLMPESPHRLSLTRPLPVGHWCPHARDRRRRAREPMHARVSTRGRRASRPGRKSGSGTPIVRAPAAASIRRTGPLPGRQP